MLHVKIVIKQLLPLQSCKYFWNKIHNQISDHMGKAFPVYQTKFSKKQSANYVLSQILKI